MKILFAFSNQLAVSVDLKSTIIACLTSDTTLAAGGGVPEERFLNVKQLQLYIKSALMCNTPFNYADLRRALSPFCFFLSHSPFPFSSPLSLSLTHHLLDLFSEVPSKKERHF